MRKCRYIYFLLLFILLLFTYSGSYADADTDYDGKYIYGLVDGGKFTSGHTERDSCPGKNPPHVFLDMLSGNCGCPTKPEIIINGCEFLIKCTLLDDDNTILAIKVPCPTMQDANPKYPLVKMLTGILAEWNVDPNRKKTQPTISYGSKGTQAYGSELFSGFDLDIIISTVDTGKKWNITKAEKIAKATEEHSRTNIEFALENESNSVYRMSAKDVYDSYKNKYTPVQAYLVLANKGYGERTWTTYEKYIHEMCKKSENAYKCKRGLLGIEMLGRVGNYWLGKGNPSVFSVYSEASSHTAHGATTINDNGEPAFGIMFRSTFYVYFHASWANHYTYGNVSDISMGYACIDVYEREHENWKSVCPEEDGNGGCAVPEELVNDPYWTTHCAEWVEVHGCVDDYIPSGAGESAEDCPECVRVYGYQDPKGKMHVDVYPISFYQSQPLLINGNK